MKRLHAALLALALFLGSALPAMAVRQTLTVKTPPSLTSGSIAADAADLTLTACDATNFEQYASTGRELVFVQNTGAGARTITFTSAADELGRTGDISTYSLAAGEFAIFGPFPVRGWRQSNGYQYLQASHAEVKVGVVTIPTSFVP